MNKVSIIITAYNEEATIGALLERVLVVDTAALGFEKEVIVVDDGSRDRTLAIAKGITGVRCFQQVPNQGKGRAVQRGVRECTGDYVLVQDADLEYDPSDYLPMLECLGQTGDRAVAVYGSRVLGQRKQGNWSGKHPRQGWGPWLAGVTLSVWTALLYQRWITDTLTGYKLYPTAVLRQLNIKTAGFETDHEITAKLIRLGVAIREAPVSYRPRTIAEGKKIGIKDGFRAVWTLLRFRFAESRCRIVTIL